MKSYSKLCGAAIVIAGLCCAARAVAEENVGYIDLEPRANRKLSGNLGSGLAGNSLSQLPMGEQILCGVKFKIGPGIVQLGSQVLDSYPEKVEGIAAEGKFAKLHMLHATCWGGGPNQEGDEAYVKDGTLIGQYVVHYDDKSTESIPIVYGEDVRDWWYVDGEAEPSRGKVAWRGENEVATGIGAHLRLYASAWTNPKPDKKITRIDYTSRKGETPAAPFCIAISAEK